MVKRIRLKVSQLEEGGNRKGKKRRGVRESIVPVDLSSEGHLQSLSLQNFRTTSLLP